MEYHHLHMAYILSSWVTLLIKTQCIPIGNDNATQVGYRLYLSIDRWMDG